MSASHKWAIWFISTIISAGYLSYSLLADDKEFFLPGVTSKGHYQIELACDSCHGGGFEGQEVIEKSCHTCHLNDLKITNDSHPRKLFTDPRNYKQVELIDASKCVTCHREHKPDITRDEGVTVEKDFCFLCHNDIAKDRKSHKTFAKDSCADSGCHKYHDNRSLYEDFLLKHADKPDTLPNASLPQRNYAIVMQKLNKETILPLSINEHDAPKDLEVEKKILQQWQNNRHAKGGVNCRKCHTTEETKNNNSNWLNKPNISTCKKCHKEEAKGFLSGLHGMRLKQSLPAMSPADARQKMKKEAPTQHPGCIACHSSHEFDIQRAAVEACLSCHDDKHSLAYKKSLHYQMWKKSQTSNKDNPTGVSCATCHLPRQVKRIQGHDVIRVQHNQNDNLRPNEKMIRSVCLNCHGLAFSINSLADTDLVKHNFSGQPKLKIKSIDMVKNRAQKNRSKLDAVELKQE